MAVTCELCGAALASGAPVIRLAAATLGAGPVLAETTFEPSRDGAVAYFCSAHAEPLRRVSESVPSRDDMEQELRGRLYQELDRLSFALEMEAHEALERGDEEAAARAQQTRLGIRLAARLVSGVPAPEVSERLSRWRSEYESKFPS